MAKKVAKAKRTVAKRTKKVAAKRVVAKKKPAKAKPRAAAKKKPAPKPKRRAVATAKKKPTIKAPARRVVAKAAKPKGPVRRAALPVPVPNPVRELAKRIVAVTLANDDDATFALYDAAVESTEMGMPPVKGIDGLRNKFEQWRDMASDSTWQARNIWVDGNSIVIEWGGRATINGKSIDLKEVAVHETRNGKIVRERFYYDTTPFQPSAVALTEPVAEEPNRTPPVEPGF